MYNSKTQQLLFYFLLFFFIVGIILKVLLAFSLPLYHDVGGYISMALLHDDAYMNLFTSEHPPFGYYTHIFLLNLFGIHDFIIRLVSLFFSFLEFIFIYLISKRLFNKTTAYYALFIFSFTYFATINSFSSELDGSILGFFSLLLLYCFYEYYQSKQSCFLWLTSLFFGFSLLIKIRAILFLLPLLFYSYYKTRNILKTIKTIFIISLSSFLLFSVFPILVYLANGDLTPDLLSNLIRHNTASTSISYKTAATVFLYKITHPLLFLQLGVVLSFLFPFLLLKSLKRLNDKLILFLSWFCSLFLSFVVLLPVGYTALYPRYIAFLAPSLVILCAKGLETLHLSQKRIVLILISSLVFSSIFLFLNQIAGDYWYLESASMGILKIAKYILFMFFFLSFFLLVLYYVFRNENRKKCTLSLFLILNLAFNIMLIADPLIDNTHRSLINDFVFYYSSNAKTLEKPIFLWASDLAFYLGLSGININMVTDQKMREYAKKIGYNDEGYYDLSKEALQILKKEGGTVFSLYYPLKYTMDLKEGRWEEYTYLQTNCKLLKSFDYKHAKGVIFEC